MVDSSGKLSDIGKYMQDAAFRLGNYGVKTGYITQDSWQTLRSDLPKVTKKSSPPKSKRYLLPSCLSCIVRFHCGWYFQGRFS